MSIARKTVTAVSTGIMLLFAILLTSCTRQDECFMDEWTREQAVSFLVENREPLTFAQIARVIEILRTLENPNVEPLTPEQVLEYIEIFRLEVDITESQLLAGERFNLTATEDTANILFSLNFFTTGMHVEFTRWQQFYNYGFFSFDGWITTASREFREDYQRAFFTKEHYTGWLTAHWYTTHRDYIHYIDFPFLRIEHVENFPSEMYWFYKNIPYEIQRRVHIEINGLSLPYFLDFIEMLRFLDWDSGPWIEYDGTGNIIAVNANADGFFAQRSELYWTDPRRYREKEMMLELGLSDENPMTFEWVMANPADAYQLFTILYKSFLRFPNARYGNPDDSFFEENGVPILPSWYKPYE